MSKHRQNAQLIRELYAEGGHSHRSLAEMFGMSKSHVWRILNGQAWAGPTRKPTKLRRTCPVCKNRFTTTAPTKKYCSPECKKAGNNASYYQREGDKVRTRMRQYMRRKRDS